MAEASRFSILLLRSCSLSLYLQAHTHFQLIRRKHSISAKYPPATPTKSPSPRVSPGPVRPIHWKTEPHCSSGCRTRASRLRNWVLEESKVGDRGLVALKNIRRGEKLLFVPPSLVTTADPVETFNFFGIRQIITEKVVFTTDRPYQPGERVKNQDLY